MKDTLTVAFIGNPNCGKTTLFNAYTGAKLKVANWPGVTVEKKEGYMKYHDHKYKLVDLPGIYSLTSYSIEERLSRQYILGDEVDVIVDVIDASSLERNLYLALQLIELGKPIVLALNMMDIVEERGMEIDLHRLPEMLGVPVIPVSAVKKRGLNALMHAVSHHFASPEPYFVRHAEDKEKFEGFDNIAMVYNKATEEKIAHISALLSKAYPSLTNCRWPAIKHLENDSEILNTYPISHNISVSNLESDIINQRYEFIEEIVEETLVNRETKSALTDKIDNLLTDPVWGIAMFAGIMALVFLLTFTIGDWLSGYLESALSFTSEKLRFVLSSLHTGDVFTSLITDGILGGVGVVLTFLPNIFILFLALGFLEDSGYMARIAYVMDGIMRRLGLSGKAFIPMLLGFGCTVPAILSSRTLESRHDRIKTILVTPFMSCSARLPIYVFFSQMFFERYAALAAFSMYIIGVVIAILSALVINLFDKNKSDNSLLIELPEYKIPNLRTMLIYAWEKVRDYLEKAGTVILFASVIIWGILNFGPTGLVNNMSESFGAYIGKFLVPVMRPAGLGFWEVIVALISGIAAKEVVVSSMSVLYGAGSTGVSSIAALLGAQGFGALNAYSMMLFCLLYVPCTATIATIKKETASLKWTVIAVALQLSTAFIVSTLFFRIANLF